MSRKASSLPGNIWLFGQFLNSRKVCWNSAENYNAIFVSLCKVSLKRTNCPGKNSHWVKDLNIQDQKDLSTYYCKMKKVPLGSKRDKLSNHHDGIDDYGQKEKEEDKHYDITKQVEKAKNNEKEKRKKRRKSK